MAAELSRRAGGGGPSPGGRGRSAPQVTSRAAVRSWQPGPRDGGDRRVRGGGRVGPLCDRPVPGWQTGGRRAFPPSVPGCCARGRTFPCRPGAALSVRSNQYLCKCSQLGKMRPAADPGEGQRWPAEGQPGGLARGKAGAGPRGLGGNLSFPRGFGGGLTAAPPPQQPVGVSHTPRPCPAVRP